MAARRMSKKNVGATPSRDTHRQLTAAEMRGLLAGGTWGAKPKRKSPGRPVLVFPFLRVLGGGTARAKPRRARARRRSGLFGGFFQIFGGPTRRQSARVLPFKKKTVRRRG